MEKIEVLGEPVLPDGEHRLQDCVIVAGEAPESDDGLWRGRWVEYIICGSQPASLVVPQISCPTTIRLSRWRRKWPKVSIRMTRPFRALPVRQWTFRLCSTINCVSESVCCFQYWRHDFRVCLAFFPLQITRTKTCGDVWMGWCRRPSRRAPKTWSPLTGHCTRARWVHRSSERERERDRDSRQGKRVPGILCSRSTSAAAAVVNTFWGVAERLSNCGYIYTLSANVLQITLQSVSQTVKKVNTTNEAFVNKFRDLLTANFLPHITCAAGRGGDDGAGSSSSSKTHHQHATTLRWWCLRARGESERKSKEECTHHKSWLSCCNKFLLDFFCDRYRIQEYGPEYERGYC